MPEHLASGIWHLASGAFAGVGSAWLADGSVAVLRLPHCWRTLPLTNVLRDNKGSDTAGGESK